MAKINWQPQWTLAQVEKMVVLEAYRFFRSNKTKTAQALGIAIRTLDHKLEQYRAEKVEAETHPKEPQRFYKGQLVQPGFQMPTLAAHDRKVQEELDKRRKKMVEEQKTKNEQERLEKVSPRLNEFETLPELPVSVQESQTVQEVLPAETEKASKRQPNRKSGKKIRKAS